MELQPTEVTIRQPRDTALERRARDLRTVADGVEVVGKGSHEDALVFLRNIAIAEQEVKILFTETKSLAHKAHRAIVAAEKKLLDPLKEARRIVSGKTAVYEREARRLADEQRRADEREARLLDEERRLDDAIAAEEAGDDDLATEILDEPASAPVVVARPETAKVAGVSSRTTWKAVVVDLRALVRYVAENDGWVHLLDANTAALNNLARSQKGALRIPGVRAVSDTSHAVRAS